MWDFLTKVFLDAITQVVILFFFLVYFFTQRKDPRLKVARLGIIRLAVLAAVFFFFLLSAYSAVNPAIRQVSVVGMVLINLLFLVNVILAFLERPYRDVLEAYALQPENQELLDRIWRDGKHLYYLRYFISAIFSGTSPFIFLGEIAGERIRQDLKENMARHGLARGFITLPALVGFLQARLAQGDFPPDFQEVITKDITQFAQHPWIEDQVNDFLTMAVETPESLYHPQWAQMWEKAKGGK
jgi:hypothetical protein